MKKGCDETTYFRSPIVDFNLKIGVCEEEEAHFCWRWNNERGCLLSLPIVCQCQPIKASCCDWTRGVSVLATLHCCTLWSFVVHCCALLCSFVLHCCEERHIVDCARWWAIWVCSVVFEGDGRRWEFVVMRVAGTRELFGSWGDTLASPAMMLSSEGGLALQPGQ